MVPHPEFRSLVQRMIRRNQREMLVKRQSVAALRSGRGRVYNGHVDVTRACAAEQVRHIGELLKANLILRGHLHHA